jgi:hypothetical protein
VADTIKMIQVDERTLVEFYEVALQLRAITDGVTRLRIDSVAACARLSHLLERVAPGLADRTETEFEKTPVAVPRPGL